MHHYLIEVDKKERATRRIVASFQTDDDEKAVLTYCKFRRSAESKGAFEGQRFSLRKIVLSRVMYLDGVYGTDLEVLIWGDEDISGIEVPEYSYQAPPT